MADLLSPPYYSPEPKEEPMSMWMLLPMFILVALVAFGWYVIVVEAFKRFLKRGSFVDEIREKIRKYPDHIAIPLTALFFASVILGAIMLVIWIWAILFV